MNHVAAEQIVTVLRQRGFDARVFGGPAGVQHRRGVAVRGVCVLGWRYPDGRWEFTDRPPRLSNRTTMTRQGAGSGMTS
ncbi:hypothetical protein [Mycobacterium sp.]|uniref:hypothetical protein n=1 Tax=Mycobacterium sp. TaxID=1785 RepID=UPI00257DB9B5|nr:hypothetical protein [Mycobacterium sp.]